MVVIVVRIHPIKPELKFWVGSNPNRGVSEVCDDERLAVIPAGNKV